MSESRWTQDIEVAQLIAHLKQEDKQDKDGEYNWSRLTKAEEGAVLKEIDRCRKDFVYAARNYFWITNKDLQDQLFTLNEAQEIIYQKVLEIKRKGKAQRIMIIKGRQLGALDPHTKVLTADLRWVHIEDLQPGDEVVAVEEYGKKGGRKMLTAKVLNKWEVHKPAFEITLENGVKVIATEDHLFLIKRKGSDCNKWTEVQHLQISDDQFRLAANGFAETEHSWCSIMDIKPLGTRRMVDIETTEKTFIAEGVVTHNCSTLIEAMIAWRTIFFANVHALVVSYDRGHTADVLFPIMTTILDKLPWFLRPMVASRKMDEGLRFDNPKAELRERYPGLDSRVYVKAANSTTGVGAGIRLSAVHASEFCLWDPSVAQKIIDQEMRYALIDSVDTFSILESTGRGANNYTHNLWKSSVARAERADWYPMFLPAFFEKRRVSIPPPNWKIELPEYRIRERIKDEWVRCSNVRCLQYHMRHSGGEDRNQSHCPTCEIGVLEPYSLTDAQCVFMEDARKNAAHDDESTKKYRQELAVTAQDSFQVEGYQVFGSKAQDFADNSIRVPIAVGDYDAQGFFHGVNNENIRWVQGVVGPFKGCYQKDCDVDHNPEWTECPLQIWQWPDKDSHYCFGADVAEGLGGKAAYSAAVMVKYSSEGREPNYQVATWRSNTIDPISYAGKLNAFGRHYNNALAAVEVNKFDSCMTTLRINLNYPNLYRWKHMDSINTLSNKLGWETNLKSRPRLWMTMRTWLEHSLFYIRSENICNEMRNFVKDSLDDAYASADSGTCDDELMAAQIALFCANENLYHEGLGIVTPRNSLNKDSAKFSVKCNSCGHSWLEISIDQSRLNPMQCAPETDASGQVQSTDGYRCPVCHGRIVEISRNELKQETTTTDADRWLKQLRGGNDGSALLAADLDPNEWEIPEYDML